MTGFSNHFSCNSDTLEAATEEQREEASKTTEEDTEAEPDILVTGDTVHKSLSAGQEDVIMDSTIGEQLVVLSVTVHCHGH